MLETLVVSHAGHRHVYSRTYANDFHDHSLVVFLLHNLMSRYLSGRVNVAAGGSWERTHFRRDRELKRRATSRIGACPQAATMRFDNPPTDRQSHASALRFGGEECIEDLVYFFRGKSDA
jgi:hypothetical protein